MFHIFCGSGAKKRRSILEKGPRVEYVQENDIKHFQERLKEANLEEKEDYQMGSGMKAKNERVVTVAQMSSPFPASGNMRTPNKSRSSSTGQIHLQNTDTRTNKSNFRGDGQLYVQNMRTPDKRTNKSRSVSVGQLHLQAQQETRRTVSLSPNIKTNRFPRSGKKHLEADQNNWRTASLSPNVIPRGASSNDEQWRTQEENQKAFSLSPNIKRTGKRPSRILTRQDRNQRGSPYGPNLQATPTTQPIRQSPIQNQEMNRLVIGNTRFPSSGAGFPSDLEALDAALGAVPNTPELQRKLQLDKILIRPIVTMKGEAYDKDRWFQRDLDSERNFHSSCTDLVQIVMLANAQETAKKVVEFLSSDMIEPRYVPSEHPFQQRRLNHFHTYWNVMHQLPFYMKKWDKKTKAKLIWFYEVGVTETLPCPWCQKHYTKWLKESPVSGNVGSIKKLNQWLFKLHDDVNRRSHKPNFNWREYERRWAPRKNTRKAESSFNGESKQDDVVNSLSVRAPSQQVANLQKAGYMMQRDVYTPPITYDNYQMYLPDHEGQPMVYDSGFTTYHYD